MQNVVKTLRVLEEVAARQPVGVGELSRRLTMPKSSVQRALRALHTAGWIRPAGGEITRWVVTTKALRVGRHAMGELSLRDAAMPVMEQLRERTAETIHLMVPEDDKVVLIERLPTPKPVRIVLALGSILPIHASANGKVVLACRPADEVEPLLAAGLPRLTDTTITDPDRLRAELREIRTCGYATNRGEWRSDIAAVAAAVVSGDGRPIASLSISTPIGRMPAELGAEYGKLVYEAAGSLSASLEPGW
jgi:IclR family acetate operon transcriptional repressor